MNVTSVLSIIFLLGGFFFFVTSTVGILRFPDFYTRLHATGKGDTLAVLLSLIGISIHTGLSVVSIKILVIALFMFLAQPTATHAISKAGMRRGIKPWVREDDKNDNSL